jgi:hypothetical protein
MSNIPLWILIAGQRNREEMFADVLIYGGGIVGALLVLSFCFEVWRAHRRYKQGEMQDDNE